MPFGFVVLGLLHAMTVILDLDRLCLGLTLCKCLTDALTGVSGGQVPNGELSSKQLRFLGDQITHLGEKGCADITTRANIQLRGMDLTDSAAIFEVRAISGYFHRWDICRFRSQSRASRAFQAGQVRTKLQPWLGWGIASY